MYHFWWFVHICGIALWFGGTAAGVLMWPSKKSLVSQQPYPVDPRTMVRVVTRTSHLGAGLTAIGGTILSLLVRPKSDLGSFWLATMQGLGVVAFFISVVVLTRLGKRLPEPANEFGQNSPSTSRRYYIWLVIVFVLLLICLFMGSFRPSL